MFPGTLFSISLFTNYMKLDDTMLGIISCTSKIVASFAYAFARNDLEIYLGEYQNKRCRQGLRLVICRRFNA